MRPHRPSAPSNPDAPISHHWNDGTHITFGVATLRVRLDRIMLEGSLFTGREPDENRHNSDKMRFGSWSGRVSYNPSQNWAFQVSHGYIKSPELLHPDEDVNRPAASAIFSLPLKNDRWLNVITLWGLNKTAGISYDLLNTAKTRLALDGQFSVFFNERSLYDLYGRNPMALEIYLRLYPGLMKMNMHHK